MRSTTVIIALLAILAACSSAPTTTTASSTTTTSVTTTAAVPTTVATPTTTSPLDEPPSTTAPPDSPCLAGAGEFASGGVIAGFGAGSGDAAQVSAIRTAAHPGCERVVVDLLTVDGAPAGAIGTAGVEYDEIAGVVRINLPAAVTRTAVVDSLIDQELAHRAYVVRTGAGRLAIDIHMRPGAAIAVRAFEVDDPARVVVDVRPDPEASPVRGATRSESIVVIYPGPGPVAGPLSIAGYARSSEVVASLHLARDEEALAEIAKTIAAGNDAWAEFTITFAEMPSSIREVLVESKGFGTGGDEVWLSVDASLGGTSGSADT